MNPQAEISHCKNGAYYSLLVHSLLESFLLMASEAPGTLVSFRVPLSREFSRLPQIERLLAGYWSRGEDKKVIYAAFLVIEVAPQSNPMVSHQD